MTLRARLAPSVIAGILYLGMASLLAPTNAFAQEPGDKAINTGCYTVITNSLFRASSPFGANGPKAQRMVETAAKQWSDLFEEYDSGWGGPTFRPLPGDLTNPCADQSSSPADAVALDPIYCAIKDFSDCSTVPGCNGDLRRCPADVCYAVDSDFNYNSGDWPSVPDTSCQVQWQSAAYDINNNQILVGPISLGEEIGVTGGTMVPGNWHSNYSKAAVFVNQDKNWDFARYNYTAASSDEMVESATQNVISAFENQLYYASDVLSNSRDFYETMLHEFGHVLGLQHTTGGNSAAATLSVMREQYYVGPQLRAADITKAQSLFEILAVAQPLDVAVSLLRPKTDGGKHEHVNNAFAIPGDGTPGSGVLDLAFTLENYSSQHSVSVEVSYCRSGANEDCSPSDEIAVDTFYLAPKASTLKSRAIPYSDLAIPEQIYIIAKVTLIDGSPGSEDSALKWNNGAAWHLGTELDHGICGNIDGKDGIDISDLIYLVNYMFKNGTAPRPLLKGDLVEDRSIDISDLIYLVNYMFKNGPRPSTTGCTPPAL